MSNHPLFASGESVDVVSLGDWLDWCAGKSDSHYIVLPLLQRGSVWKPNQLIDLWDSLLRGHPVGSFMLQVMPCRAADGTAVRVRRPGRQTSEPMAHDGFGLLDGQQRTLAMLTGWPGVEQDRRLWVDLSDMPGKEHLFRLRVTTENHPFGFQRENPSQRLSHEERRRARELNDLSEDAFPDFRKTFPYRSGEAFFVDMKDLVGLYVEEFERWFQSVCELGSGRALLQAAPENVRDRAIAVHRAIGRVLALRIPIIRLDIDDLEEDSQSESGADPALAILFRRVGANGTPLSNADYIFSVIKHYCPQVHDLVERIHSPEGHDERDANVASLLTPTDVVGTAVRLAMTRCVDGSGEPIKDQDALDKNQFHRLLKQEVVAGSKGSFLEAAFLPLLESKEDGIASLLSELSGLLRYRREEGDVGLPPYALLLLDRALIQVLLYWLMAVREAGVREVSDADRLHMLRFILFWAQCVTDSARASRVAFDGIRHARTSGGPLGGGIFNQIYKALVREGRAIRLFSPADIKRLAPQAVEVCADSVTPLLGWSRFKQTSNEGPEERSAREFYQRWWWGWHYQNDLLLWLQRDYVAGLPGSPVAGREEDTPYDFDHILPQSHWSDWTGDRSGTTIRDFMPTDDKQYWLLGNSIGNVRVLCSSRNRSDGDQAPALKLTEDILASSAIESDHLDWWVNASGGEKKKEWSVERARSFQKAVEARAFSLYTRYFTDLDFDAWSLSPDDV